MRKSDELAKTPSRFAYTKVSSLLHLLIAVLKGKTLLRTESTTLARQSETKCRDEKESRNRPWIFFRVFYCSSNMCLLAGPVLTGSHLGVKPLFRSSPQLLAVFLSSCQVFNCTYLVASGHQLTLFLFSIPCPLLTAVPFEFPSANQNSFLICCRHVSIFNPSVPNYFT